ncbi:MAG: sulfite exporter TauE/SafE family protein [Bacteroidales bacterium]|nr:sulfite exporter TauE/SafE family protein [Bacteroidales bacterium]
MEILQNLLDQTNMPFLSALILGLMTAISPCPLATNITATAYISKDIQNKNRIFVNGLIYTAGRALSYTLLGILLYFGASKFELARFFQTYGERFLGFILVVGGLFMLGVFSFSLKSSGKLSERIKNAKGMNSSVSALLLGVVFALAFCPYSGVLYFGMLIPMTISSPQGLFLPIVFAIATGLPVIIIAYLLAYSVSGIGNFYNKIKSFEFWFRRVTAVVFILAGFYYIWIFYFAHLVNTQV